MTNIVTIAIKLKHVINIITTNMQQLNWMKINWNASKIESKGVIAGDEFISKSWKNNASKIFLIMNMIWF